VDSGNIGSLKMVKITKKDLILDIDKEKEDKESVIPGE